jgi:transcriptional regulator with XRE-family HTH domain
LKSLRSSTSRIVARILTEAREKAGLKQRGAAARVKRVPSVIAMIETEQRQVTVHEFITLAEAYGADPAKLFRQVLRERAKERRATDR